MCGGVAIIAAFIIDWEDKMNSIITTRYILNKRTIERDDGINNDKNRNRRVVCFAIKWALYSVLCMSYRYVGV